MATSAPAARPAFVKRFLEVRKDSLAEAEAMLLKAIEEKEGKERILNHTEEMKLREANRLQFYLSKFKEVGKATLANVSVNRCALLFKFINVPISGDAIEQYQHEYKPYLYIPIDGWIEDVLHDLNSFMHREVRKLNLEYYPCCSERTKDGFYTPKSLEGAIVKLKVKLEPEKMKITSDSEKIVNPSLYQLNRMIRDKHIWCDVELAFAWKMGNRVGLTFKCKELSIMTCSPTHQIFCLT